jgi:hypothetical protein
MDRLWKDITAPIRAINGATISHDVWGKCSTPENATLNRPTRGRWDELEFSRIIRCQ